MNRKIPKRVVALVALVAVLLVSTNAAAGDKAGGGAPDWSQQWYLRLTVTSPDDDSLRDRGNVLGQLDDSLLGQDGHDLIELNPFASPYLTLVFPHHDWPEAGNYSSDFHATNADDPDQWYFEILSDDRYRNITLYWDQLSLVERDGDLAAGERGRSRSPLMDSAEDLVERMWLEDTLTGDRIYAAESGQLQSYSFNMEGSNSRGFRWVMDERFGRQSKTTETGRAMKANHDIPEHAADAHDRIAGPPPAVGRK